MYKNLIEKTEKRMDSFNIMCEYLDTIDKPTILETGCSRTENSFGGDGMSTLIFDAYINQKGGTFTSVDISEINTNFARSKVSNLTNIVCSDSVKFLFNYNDKLIDLLYLDSYDLALGNPHPSTLHHIFELTAIISKLNKRCMIAADDNLENVGKGFYINEFMNHINCKKIYSGYQWIWILER